MVAANSPSIIFSTCKNTNPSNGGCEPPSSIISINMSTTPSYGIFSISMNTNHLIVIEILPSSILSINMSTTPPDGGCGVCIVWPFLNETFIAVVWFALYFKRSSAVIMAPEIK